MICSTAFQTLFTISSISWLSTTIDTHAFIGTQPRAIISSSLSTTKLHAAPAKKVHIFPTEEEVTSAVHKIVESAANDAIASKGSFALAIPGGSVLKVLSTLDPSSDWPS